MGKVDSRAINALIQQGAWGDARHEIKRALAGDQQNHWLLTQLGVTHYEQGHYGKALDIFTRSISIVPDCPLTLWNLAGAFDAVGEPKVALRIYAWLLLKSKKSAKDDPCWESEKWAESLHADCVYRAGICLQRLKKPKLADQFFRQYINACLDGVKGTYPIDEAAKYVQANQRISPDPHRRERREAMKAMLEDASVQSFLGIRKKSRMLSPKELIPG